MTERIIIPIAVSADGRRNAYYHRCHVHGQQRAYAACIARIEGRLEDSIECLTAIEKTDCPAQQMREIEKTKGESLYFVERSIVQDFIGKVKSWVMPTLTRKAPSPGKLDLDAIEDNIYKDMINRPVKKLDLKPGESPIDAIRRMKKGG